MDPFGAEASTPTHHPPTCSEYVVSVTESVRIKQTPTSMNGNLRKSCSTHNRPAVTDE